MQIDGCNTTYSWASYEPSRNDSTNGIRRVNQAKEFSRLSWLVNSEVLPIEFEQTYWVVEPSEPLLVDLDIIEDRSIETV